MDACVGASRFPVPGCWENMELWKVEHASEEISWDAMHRVVVQS